MKLTNVDGHLFNPDGSRYRVAGHPVILASEKTAKEYCVLHGHELISEEEIERSRRAEWDELRSTPMAR